MYHGFNYRDILIEQNVSLAHDQVILEIGLGTGSNIVPFSRKVREYHGFDISGGTIDLLRERIRSGNVFLETVDVCAPVAERYRNRFDLVFSADTIEHLEAPRNFFENLLRILKPGGRAVLMFPNESAQMHHGVTWYETRSELVESIPAGLTLANLREIRQTRFFDLIQAWFWKKPRMLVKRAVYEKSQINEMNNVFENSVSFTLNQKRPLLASVLNLYTGALVSLVKLGGMFEYHGVHDGNIGNRYLVIELVKV